MSDLIQSINDASDSVRQHVNAKIDWAIILGSGLSDIELEGFEQIACLDYSSIKGLPKTTALSHIGELRFLQNSSTTIAVCAGRHHLYEGYNAQQVSTLTYLLRKLGCENLIITNAAGALNEQYEPGDVMLISDHINLTGQNPLVVSNAGSGQGADQDNILGPAFADMSDAYNRQLRDQASKVASSININCHQGIYVGVLGSSLETSAERRLFRQFGGDAVGMSTVIENIAANHCQMRVLGISAITNKATGNADQQADTIEDVLKHAAIAGNKIKLIVETLLNQLD